MLTVFLKLDFSLINFFNVILTFMNIILWVVFILYDKFYIYSTIFRFIFGVINMKKT